MAAPIIASILPQSATVGDPSFTLVVRGNNFTTDTLVQFGNSKLTTIFIDENTLQAQVLTQVFPVLSLGGVSVIATNAQGTSNSTNFTVTQRSPIDLTDVLNIANAISVADLNLPALTSNPYLQEISNIEIYLVKDGDTLQSIAGKVSGNPDRWRDIAFINNLRYPFISNDAEILQGQMSYSLYITRTAKVGDAVVYVNGINKNITKDAILFFSLKSPLTNGKFSTVSDVVQIVSVSRDQVPADSRIVISSQLLNTYDVGTKVDVLTTSNNTTSRVVSPGNFIIVPSGNRNESIVKSDPLNLNNAYAMLGQDIRLDDNGLLQADDNGDLQSVLGLDCLNQALNHRLVTERGELQYHPNYGNPLLDYIGQVNSHTLAVLANHETGNTILADPRIRSIRDISTTVRGDTLNVRIIADVDLLNTTTEFNFVLRNT
jgi:phage baseplate assembly protein W